MGSAGLVVSRKAERANLCLQQTSNEQYNFAVSFIKVGDYETRDLHLKNLLIKTKTMI